MAEIELLWGISTPREPFGTEDLAGSSSLLFCDAVGHPQSNVVWKADTSTVLRVREFPAGTPIEVDGPAKPMLFHPRPAQLEQEGESFVATYTGDRRLLKVGRHELQLAWTCQEPAGTEIVCAVTHHTLRVLPRRPAGAWADEAPSTEILDAVFDRLTGDIRKPADALKAFVDSLADNPGQIFYDPNGDSLTEPNTVESDRYLERTGRHPLRTMDRAGLIETLAYSALRGKVAHEGSEPARLAVDCHGLAHIVTLVGQLLGLPVERWTLAPTKTLVPLCALGQGTVPPGEEFGKHSVVAWPEHPSGKPRILDVCLYEGAPEWETREEYARKMDMTGARWRRRVSRPSAPLFFRDVDDLRRRGSRKLADAICRAMPPQQVWGVYVGRGEPGWAQIVRITPAGISQISATIDPLGKIVMDIAAVVSPRILSPRSFQPPWKLRMRPPTKGSFP
jgi:hypothetical protein